MERDWQTAVIAPGTLQFWDPRLANRAIATSTTTGLKSQIFGRRVTTLK